MCYTVDRDNTKVLVLYPEKGVTKLQKLQLLSTQSEIVNVVGEFHIIVSFFFSHCYILLSVSREWPSPVSIAGTEKLIQFFLGIKPLAINTICIQLVISHFG